MMGKGRGGGSFPEEEDYGAIGSHSSNNQMTSFKELPEDPCTSICYEVIMKVAKKVIKFIDKPVYIEDQQKSKIFNFFLNNKSKCDTYFGDSWQDRNKMLVEVCETVGIKVKYPIETTDKKLYDNR